MFSDKYFLHLPFFQINPKFGLSILAYKKLQTLLYALENIFQKILPPQAF